MKRALVTGASSGIGREFAIALSAQGYAITAVARREDRLQALVEELPGEGHCYALADLTSAADVAAIRKRIDETQFSLLVNNAGFSALEPFYESSLEQQQRILAVNCQALMELAHSFLRRAQPGDALINVASIVGFLPTPAQPMYSASKAFAVSLSECLHEEHHARDIYVMGLCPGITRTEFFEAATGGEANGDNLPDFLMQSTEEVVAEALVALKRRKKTIVVTGWMNRAMLLMPRFLTRHRLLKVLAVIGDPSHAL